jgi:hypothetical protein
MDWFGIRRFSALPLPRRLRETSPNELVVLAFEFSLSWAVVESTARRCRREMMVIDGTKEHG